MKCEKHEWETLDDGSRICFECDEREESHAPLKKIGRQPDRDYDRNPPGIPVEATVETDICQNRHKGNPQSESAFESIRKELPLRRALCLVLIHKAASKGLTVHELSEQLGTTPNAVSGRLTELKREGLICKIGTRPTPTGGHAAVYVSQEEVEC